MVELKNNFRKAWPLLLAVSGTGIVIVSSYRLLRYVSTQRRRQRLLAEVGNTAEESLTNYRQNWFGWEERSVHTVIAASVFVGCS